MRTFLRSFVFFTCLLPAFLFANVYVHGIVKYPNGTPIANYAVQITGDSAISSPSCYQTHTRFTNAQGFYSDTLLCNTAMSKVTVWTRDYCTNLSIVHNYTLTAAIQTVESNFIVCDSSNVCIPYFTWQFSGGVSSHIVAFNSTGSHGAFATDTVISRTWTFGDGTSLSGNVVNPVHTYSLSGTYNTCLKIKTLSGCESTVCQPVLIAANTICAAAFTWQVSPIAFRIKFNSSPSTTTPGDSIISRKWKFGDGDSLLGNVVSPEHTYPQAGNYTACLTIKTAQGCEKTLCSTVVAVNVSVSCHATFGYQLLTSAAGFPVKFNGHLSTTAPGDSIVQYQWSFGDGTSGTGTDPTHTYTQPGTYTACLIIGSAFGCHDSTCKTIIIQAPPTPHCEAVFYPDSTAPAAGSNPVYHYFRFNSTASHGIAATDSIISRKWKFGDGDSLTGNTVMPVHGYAQPGTYNVCLYIQSASGCRDTVCHPVAFAAPPVACRPRFTTLANALTVTFNGASTSIASGDSITSRTWNFGDGAISTSNAVVLTHQYAAAGIFTACLTIHTRLGCTATWCKTFPVITVSGNCVPFFTKEQVAAPGKTIRFNSTAAYSQLPNDTITSRKWEFGDGQILTGNVVNPLHTYALGGTYNVCLTIYTAGCDKRWCRTIEVLPLDSLNQTDSVNIVNLYPNPVSTQLNAVVHSTRNNITAELSIYDVYGVKKWYQNVTLPAGNSTYNIATSQLATGPYIFKVTTQYGIKSRSFYKVN